MILMFEEICEALILKFAEQNVSKTYVIRNDYLPSLIFLVDNIGQLRQHDICSVDFPFRRFQD